MVMVAMMEEAVARLVAPMEVLQVAAKHRLHKGTPVVEGVGGSAVVAKAAEDIP